MWKLKWPKMTKYFLHCREGGERKRVARIGKLQEVEGGNKTRKGEREKGKKEGL